MFGDAADLRPTTSGTDAARRDAFRRLYNAALTTGAAEVFLEGRLPGETNIRILLKAVTLQSVDENHPDTDGDGIWDEQEATVNGDTYTVQDLFDYATHVHVGKK
jgi:hypothetical protein